MKKLLLSALCAIVAGSTFAASPAATREWVRRFVSTNTVEAVFDPTPISVVVTNNQGEAERITVSFEVAENDAFQVFDSSVVGMANGTLFAKTTGETYKNTGNILCKEFSGAWEQFGTMKTRGEYQYVTNGTSVATNVIYRATNEVWMTRYTATVGSISFKSTEIMDGVHLFTATNTTASFFVRARKITNAQKNALTYVAPSSVSFFDILFPSAYAYTIGPHETTYVEETPTKRITHWEAHLFTDSNEAQKISVGSITITSANGQQMTYELGITIIDVGQGIDFCDLKSIHVATDDEILSAIETAVGRNRAIQLSRSQEWQTSLEKKLTQADTIAANLSGTECPQEGKDEEDIPQDEPEPPPEHQCRKFAGTCGHWECLECHEVYDSVDEMHPAAHSYQYPEGKLCKKCVYCGIKSNAQSDHGGWWAGQSAEGRHTCNCECGRFELNHLDVGDVIEYKPDANPLVCLQIWRCGRCNQVVTGDGSLFLSSGGETITKTTHDETTNGKFQAVETNGMKVCRLTYTCAHLDENGDSLGCGAIRSENLFHVIGWDMGAISSMGDDENHVIKYPCCNGFTHWSRKTSEWGSNNPAWCGYYETTNAPHYWESKVIRYNDPNYPATPQYHKRLFVCGSLVTMKGDGVNTCGKHIVSNEEHVITSSIYKFKTDAVHSVSNVCGECFGRFYAEDEPHEPSGEDICTYINHADHAVSNFCNKCQSLYKVGDGIEAHTKREGVNVYDYLDWHNHVVSNYCDRCNGWYIGSVEEHTPRSVFPTGYAPNGGWNHNVSNICEKCGSGYVDQVGVLCTDGSWELNETNKTTTGKDVLHCKYCSNTKEVDHRFVPDGDTMHHCSNGSGHIWEAHTWSAADTNFCMKCLWHRDTHQRDPDPTNVVVRVTCPSCASHPTSFQCWGEYTNGILTDSHCSAGWDAVARRCGCVMCARSLIGCCLCTYADIFPGPWDAPTAGSNN